MAEIGSGSPNPRFAASTACASHLGPSHLFATTMIRTSLGAAPGTATLRVASSSSLAAFFPLPFPFPPFPSSPFLPFFFPAAALVPFSPSTRSRSSRATSSSCGVTPFCVSITSSTMSALRTASEIWCSMSPVSVERSAPVSSYRLPSETYTPNPPVSVTSTLIFRVESSPSSGGTSSTMDETRSRVVPAVGSTIDTFLPAIMFKSDDLPTLGRPTIAMRGRGIGSKGRGPFLPLGRRCRLNLFWRQAEGSVFPRLLSLGRHEGASALR